MNNPEDILADMYEQHADPNRAVGMAQYMRNLFPFYGISKPVRAVIDKPVLQELKSSTPDKRFIHALWDNPQREYQYFCLEYLFATKKHWPEDIITDFEEFIISKSWWDSVDFLSIKLVGEYFRKWPSKLKNIIGRWTNSDNMWLNRAAILFQLKYKDKTDTDLLYSMIRMHIHSNEFFIQKAIGWALREYSYTDADSVLAFINSTALKPLSKREAMKRLTVRNLQ